MPNNEEHSQESLKRYGKSFSELHKWMDEPSAILGANHRKYRHDPNITPREAKELFGENADNACLDHIRLDEIEKRKRFSSPMTIYESNLKFEPSSGTWNFQPSIWNLQKYCIKCGRSCDSVLDNCPICQGNQFHNDGKHMFCSNCQTSYDSNFGKCPECGQVNH